MKIGAILVARPYWHLALSLTIGGRDASCRLAGFTSAASVETRGANNVSAEYVKVRAPFDSGTSNQSAALFVVSSAGRKTSR
ncbi:hypothetical protein DLM46_04870 [Paraburkholderia lacunae]|uniref:Uncharacterized protein n=1 Tax=Paraburkholderia lacunae TaxID=2211104 RepID=A0A370ND95_9BURK|nr:hypothetical protein DLM46_04870 [Paraburkholderia lacunae]